MGGDGKAIPHQFSKKDGYAMHKKHALCLCLALTLMVFTGTSPVAAADHVNPSRAEIAQKLEAVAYAKNIPSVILKTIAFCESGWQQWDSEGNAIGDNPDYAHPALGMMQVVSYDVTDTALVEKLKYDIDFNIAYGADLLNQKWLNTPRIGDNDRNVLENWYFAIWAYHSWSLDNNPNDRALLEEVPYQEAVFRRAAVDYYPGYCTPVEISRIDPTLLPLGYLPELDSVWETPEPRHYGDLGLAPGTERQISEITAAPGFTTADQVALAGWSDGSDTVIIARKDDFPDALAGMALAAYYNAPMLLNSPEALDPGVLEVLSVLAPTRLIILGGEGAISSFTENALRENLPQLEEISRLAGVDRYETAALIAAALPPTAEVALATGLNYPDALTLAAAGASRGLPVLLTGPDAIPEVTLSALRTRQPTTVHIAGGTGVISEAVTAELLALGVAESDIHRYAGSDRYETSALIAAAFFPRGEIIFLADGQDYGDALAGGVAAALQGGCLLLTDVTGGTIAPGTTAYLQQATGLALTLVTTESRPELLSLVMSLL
jgi:putative cell wall-binding protein